MENIQILDKQFRISIKADAIQNAIKQVANRLNSDFEGKNPLFICILNGAFMFAGDLMKHITLPCEVTFVKLSSYDGTTTTGVVNEVMGLNESVVGRNVVVIEDIVETGFTMQSIIASLRAKGAADIKICTLLQKPNALQCDVNVDYVAITIPNDFIVGYGLDYAGYGRNSQDIYTLC